MNVPLTGGRLTSSSLAPTHFAPNAVPFVTGSLCVAVGISAASWHAGLPYGPNGRLCVDTTGAPIVGYSGGIAMTASGRVACDTAGAAVGFIRGIPITAQGRVAMTVPT